MKNKHFFIVLLLFFCVLAGIHGQSKDDFAALVDFTLDMETLADLASSGEDVFSEDAPLVIITGAVAARIVLQPGPEDYLSEIELLDGRWQGVESVTTFRCIVQFRGPEYENFVPARRSRRPPPEEIPLNATVMVVGRPVSTRSTNTGTLAVLDGFFVRVLEQ